MRRLSPSLRDRLTLALLIAATLTLVAALAAGTWAWMSGQAQAALAEVRRDVVEAAARAGLRLRQIEVAGRARTRSGEILAAIDLPQGGPLLALDPAAARDRLESLPWVKEAVVERRLPDVIHLRLTERTPIALWDRGDGDFVLVDADGAAIPGDIGPFAGLPVISGAGAPRAAADLFTLLSGEPALSGALLAAVRVGDRRWNLWFHAVGEDGVEVRLPETGVAAAVARLARLEERDGLLDRAVRMIDMRLPDRLVVRLPEDALPDSGHRRPPDPPLPLPLHGAGRDA
jgi:cell division protein FtsQ